MLCNFTINYIKISSRELMIKHEQLNLNYSTKHIISQKLFCETLFSGIVKPSVTIPGKSPIIGSLTEPEFHGHFRPYAYHNTICCTIYTINTPKQPLTVTATQIGFQNFLIIRFQDLGTIKRPLMASINSNTINTLK